MTTDPIGETTTETARALLYWHGLPEDVIDGALCLHAQELAARIRTTDLPDWFGSLDSFDNGCQWAADLIDPTVPDGLAGTANAVPAAVSVSAAAPPTDRGADAETVRRLLAQRQEMAEERYAWQERGDRAEARVRELEAGAALLTGAERTMLTFALDQAQEKIWSEDGFTDEDQAAVTSLRRLAAETAGPETQGAPEAEDPARIDRMRPEFTDHASVEAIDAHLRRARSQERRWHLRAEWLISLRSARVAQKARGEQPAAAPAAVQTEEA